MTESFIVAFTTFFATIGPIDVAAMFAVLTPQTQARKSIALRGVAIATGILLVFAVTGEVLLNVLGISLAALRVAGGVLLLLIGIEMVFARASGGTSTIDAEESEAVEKQDISVFPLATPLIAGPGAMGAVILLMAETKGDFIEQTLVVSALLLVLAITLLLLFIAPMIIKVLGVTGMNVIGRIFGVLLTALAVQFVLDGIVEAGLFSG